MDTAITIPANQKSSVYTEESQAFVQPESNISPSVLRNSQLSIFGGTTAASLFLAISDCMSVSIQPPFADYPGVKVRYNTLTDSVSIQSPFLTRDGEPFLSRNGVEPRYNAITDLFCFACTIAGVACTVFTMCSVIHLEEHLARCKKSLVNQMIIIGASFTTSFITTELANAFWRSSPDSLFWLDNDSAAHCVMMRTCAYAFTMVALASFVFGASATYTATSRKALS